MFIYLIKLPFIYPMMSENMLGNMWFHTIGHSGDTLNSMPSWFMCLVMSKSLTHWQLNSSASAEPVLSVYLVSISTLCSGFVVRHLWDQQTTSLHYLHNQQERQEASWRRCLIYCSSFLHAVITNAWMVLVMFHSSCWVAIWKRCPSIRLRTLCRQALRRLTIGFSPLKFLLALFAGNCAGEVASDGGETLSGLSG